MSRSLLRASPELCIGPFPYFIATHGLGRAINSAVLEWFENEAPWKLVETDFYEQYEFSLSGARLPPPLTFLGGRALLEDLRASVERAFGRRLGERIDCTAHKLVHGQRIRIHNDYIPGGETHRVLIQLNRGWNDEQGGYLMLFNSEDPSDVHRVLSPINDSVVGFAISEKSNHAVSTVYSGERFTLVFSFYDNNLR